MKAHGMGGFFMHSREGLETEYMGEEWLTSICKAGRSPATSPESSRTEGLEWTPEYVVEPYGLFGQVRVVAVRA